MSNKNIRNLDKMKSIIGNRLFIQVTKELGGENIHIASRAEHYNKRERNDKIRNEFYTNSFISREEWAFKYKLSLDRVNKILAYKSNDVIERV